MIRWLCLSVAMALPATTAADEVPAKGGPDLLFASFRGNGEDGLHLASSHDGLCWSALCDDKPFLQPRVGSRLMRDPCIARGPDGTFHLVWTTGWWDRGIGIAHSSDLIHWSKQTWLPLMQHEPRALNCWAPEIFFDQATGKYLIYWSTTIPGRFAKTDNTGDLDGKRALNHRIYYVTTRDFSGYSKARLLYDGGFDVIDATIIKDHDRYVMFVKDESLRPRPKKNLRIAVADKAEGPYGAAAKPFTPHWVEGPTAIKLGESWYVYYDAYTRKRMEGAKSADLKHWTPITEQLVFPPGTRHGTVFTVPEATLRKLEQHD